MLYRLFYFPARLAIFFFCRKVSINDTSFLKTKGPLLLAVNHPNSFLDAIIFATVFRQTIYSLARGDVFVSDPVNRILFSLNMMPVYRISEGAKNVKNNFNTFGQIQQLFKRGKTVLIFSEGGCINEWHLRPLKKGTARIAFEAWQSDINLKILPVGINYSSFRHFGKNIIIRFGNPISKENIQEDSEGKKLAAFNSILEKQLSNLVYEIPDKNKEMRKEIFEVKTSSFKKIILALPTAIGYLVNSPFYYAIHFLIKKRARDFYDSIMVGAMFLFYPLYVLFITLAVWYWSHNSLSFLLLIIIPATALSIVHSRHVVE